MTTNDYTINDTINTENLNAIYLSLSISPEDNFDEIDEISEIISIFEKIYNQEILRIESNKLSNNKVLLNNTFVTLLKYSFDNKINRKAYLLFSVYCDYFDLTDYPKIYNSLHEKLQTIIKNSFIIYIGKARFEKLKKEKQKHQNVVSLFDLI